MLVFFITEPKRYSWRDNYPIQDRPRWNNNYIRVPTTTSTARTPGVRDVDRQGRVPNTPTYVKDPVQAEEKLSPTLLSADSGKCGIDAITNDRIIGGSDTHIKQHPWLVQIEYHDENGVAVRECEGFLINQRYVLSAGHCFKGIGKLKPVNVILGEYDQTHEGRDCVDNEGCTDDAVKVPIEDIKLHLLYRLNFMMQSHHDIALVRMRRPVEYTKFIRPICLPTSDITKSPPADLRLTIAGWGRTESSGSSSVKREVDLPYVNMEECKRNFNFIVKGHLCAGGEPDKDSCQGDSGGPLMYNRDGVYIAVGIISTGDSTAGCGNKMALYTKVSNYISWINESIKP